MLTRRACLAAAQVAALAPLATRAATADTATDFDPASPLPHKSEFTVAGTYLNCASQHPLSRGGRAAIEDYMESRSFSGDGDWSFFDNFFGNLENFAQLINASPEEVCYVQSTTVGENLVLKALDLPAAGGRIVTDELHYVGSLPTYKELSKQGVEVVTLRTTDGKIDVAQFEAAIDRKTRLVAISSVSMVNGFKHDLAAISEIAHARGALVYADVVHQVGSTPLDVREANVDFCSSASYKWLMAEQGLGFLYARKDILDALQRPWFGHYQLARRSGHAFPNPEPDAVLTEYEHYEGALGLFAMGSQSNIVGALLGYSLPYLLAVGVERIQAHRQPLIDRLQDVLPRLGYPSITPRDSGTPIASFRHAGDAAGLRDRLRAAGVTITVAAHHLRVSPSVFNDMDDIERLIEVLARD